MNNDIKKMICPACGASLEIQGHSFTAKCPYCDTVTKVTPKGMEKEEAKSTIRMRELEQQAQITKETIEQQHRISVENDKRNWTQLLIVCFVIPIILLILVTLFNIQ